VLQEDMLKKYNEHRRTPTDLPLYKAWRSLFGETGAKCKSLIARHFVTHLRVTDRKPVPATIVGDLTWLKDASVAPALFCLFTTALGRAQSIAKVFGMYPYLSNEESRIVGAFLVNGLVSRTFSYDEILSGLNLKKPVEQSNLLYDYALLGSVLYLIGTMTGEEIESPESLFSALSMTPGDSLYESTLRDWITQSFALKSGLCSLPSLE
jgi:hypothetical protein